MIEVVWWCCGFGGGVVWLGGCCGVVVLMVFSVFLVVINCVLIFEIINQFQSD